MFAVCAADNGIFADLDIIGNKSALNNSAICYFCARHQDAVDNLGAGAYFGSCEQDRIFNLSVDQAALCDKSFFNGGVFSDILWE